VNYGKQLIFLTFKIDLPSLSRWINITVEIFVNNSMLIYIFNKRRLHCFLISCMHGYDIYLKSSRIAPIVVVESTPVYHKLMSLHLHTDKAIKKMLATLDDPFTRFLEPEKLRSLRVEFSRFKFSFYLFYSLSWPHIA